MKLNKKTAIFLVLLLLFSLFSLPALADDIKLEINGVRVVPAVAPVVENSTTLVPLRIISENLGATVTWEAADKSINIEQAGRRIELQLNNLNAKVDGQSQQLLLAPREVNGTTLVPVRFVAESLNVSVDWDEQAKIVRVFGQSGKTAAAQMTVHFIDVGQADAVLVQSGSANLLIDAGNNDDGGLVVAYLQQQGVAKLDYLIGSHPHEDHIGGLDDVIDNFTIGTVIMPAKEHTTQTFEDVLDALSAKGLKLTKPIVGTTYQLGNAAFTVIAPNGDYGDELNDWSVGIYLSDGCHSFVMCGDAEAAAEADILQNGCELKADVLKLGHHGSRTSTSDAFLTAVAPRYAVISCGADNDYGHPHAETLAKLNKAGITLYRTDLLGTIVVQSSASSLDWQTTGDSLTPQPSQTVVQPSKTAVQYVLNTDSKKFHLPSCSSVDTISAANKQLTDESRASLLDRGYQPCKRCNP